LDFLKSFVDHLISVAMFKCIYTVGTPIASAGRFIYLFIFIVLRFN